MRHRTLPLVLLALAPLLGCAELQRLADLRRLDFELTGVQAAELAGVDLQQRLDAFDLARIAGVAAGGSLPLDAVLTVTVENPSENAVAAHLVELDWTLLLEGRETVRGVLRPDLEVPAGGTAPLPVPVSLDLLRFFRDHREDLVGMARRAFGSDDPPREVRLVARPTVQTPLGPIRYPEPITITARQL